MGNIFSVSISGDATFSRCLDCTAAKTAYIRELKDSLGDLQTEYRKLIEARNDVTKRVMIAEEQHEMKRLDQVQGWLSRVEAVGTEVEEIIKDSSQEIDRLCLGGYCSRNCKSSYKFGKRVAEKLRAVATLKSERDFKDVAGGLEMPWREASGNYRATWRRRVVSKDHQIEKIQEEIGEKIGLSSESWKTKSLLYKAQDLFKILSKKKFVLVLDDIWERVDLTKVGILHPDPNNGSKIVFTTRFVEVCGHMEAHKHFRVEFLENEQAWKLFKSKVGEDTLNNHPGILELAKIVAKECGALPLALITIGRAMAFKKTPEEWRYAIQVLKRSDSEFPGMNEVYPRLKFTYDSLPNDKVRSCFLYCSLLSEDFIVRKGNLIDCWIGEGFLDEYEGIEARNQGYHFIGILLNACLLEEVSGVDDRVKMHDVIRDMALWIACKVEKEKENFLVHAGARLKEAPKADQWTGVRRISLMKNQIKNLSEVPTCPRLLTLFLNSNSLEMITNDFFQSMSSLKLLDLSVNPLTDLPSGISKLVSLQHLDLSSTQLEELPKELKALVNLKCLNLDYTLDLAEHMQARKATVNNLEEVKIDIICKVQEIREPHGFRNLRSLYVSDCFAMEEIIDISKFGEVQQIMGNLNPFVKVNECSLRILPKLKSIHRNALSFPLLQQMKISECPLLKKIPLDSSRAITNKHEFVIRGDKHWWEGLEWEDEATQNVFLPFFRTDN
ncbi:hypothetical protein Patl1_34309 [Pistacia atlantica]|uniref:Uncharacterized protein n=1 Tax=Pistacia atlantica TaxID=434234 RepID=A0ACC0ZUC5_9ROSI|nr:hypothetical protein Patl1_34309 [Pistacia atlantica]